MNTFKIRPFKIPILLNSIEAIVITGFIKGKDLIINCFDKNYHLSSIEIGTDKKGPFAMLKESVKITNGFTLTVEPDFENVDDYVEKGCCITFKIPDILFEESTIYNLIIPPIFSVSVFFNYDGKNDGYSFYNKSGSGESTQA